MYVFIYMYSTATHCETDAAEAAVFIHSPSNYNYDDGLLCCVTVVDV